MELIPFEDMPQGPSREMPFNNSGFQIYHNPMLSINGVEMRRLVLTVKHLDDDTQKPADLRHGAAPSFAGLDTGAAPSVTSNFQALMSCHARLRSRRGSGTFSRKKMSQTTLGAEADAVG
jgi:hypothetical protein